MERAKTPEDGKVQWRKVGGGSFRMADGKIIKPNQVFSARKEEIPKAFLDAVVPLEALPDEKPLEVSPPGYEIRERSTGWWDVVEPVSGKALNEKALRREQAEELLQELLP